ncbi:MAG: transposase [Undibacterium sp.]|nr:transposase [Opitutaceae bacterium]
MARKLRLEFEGATYHVISRGNYRADVFRADATRAAFMKCLGEASDKSGWVVHAWCVMSNHYHLCFTTPRPNLVEGMRWLQATFSNRFNRLRNERGHVFQGRYRAPIVAPEAVGAVCHYIHLNPVRAGVVGMPDLPQSGWSSLPLLLAATRRPRWFSPEAALAHAGGLRDTPRDRRRYVEYLGWLQEDEAGKKALEFDRLSKDWAVGEKDFKKGLLKAHRHLEGARERGDIGPRELSMEFWRERLDLLLAALKKDDRDIAKDPKGEGWKVAVAADMKTATTASNPWLAKALGMGSPFRLSRLVSACHVDPRPFQIHLDQIAKRKV